MPLWRRWTPCGLRSCSRCARPHVPPPPRPPRPRYPSWSPTATAAVHLAPPRPVTVDRCSLPSAITGTSASAYRLDCKRSCHFPKSFQQNSKNFKNNPKMSKNFSKNFSKKNPKSPAEALVTGTQQQTHGQDVPHIAKASVGNPRVLWPGHAEHALQHPRPVGTPQGKREGAAT